ncbi:ABC transporter permease [Modestobacter roseus]|uniref:ABC transporter permease n=1 Tax=Modestobacter roseus TaxID=1181884 RepID=UPI0034DFA7A7
MSAARAGAGTGTLLRFALRRDRVRLPVWALLGALLVAVQTSASQSTYDTPESLVTYRATVGSNAASIALSGPPVGLDTVAGTVAFEMATPLALVAVLMVMFTVVRHTRADEEAGRTELVRSARVGRHAPLFAATGTAGAASVALGAAVTTGAVSTGLPAGGAVLLGASVAGTGLVFTGVTAVLAQVSGGARGVYGLVGAVLGLAVVLRAVGDVEGNGLSWASPIGWAQATHPWSDDRWSPLLVCLAAVGALVLTARQLVDHRDLGAGLVAPGPARATAPRSLRSPLGLAWRLHRGALLGWAVGVSLLGAVYGLLAESVETLLADTPEAAQFLPDGSPGGLVDAYLSVTVTVNALLATAYGVSAAIRARTEEAAGRAEPVLATATGRIGWLGSHVLVALAGTALLLVLIGLATGAARATATGDAAELSRLAGAALGYAPAVWLVTGVAVALAGVLPAAATAAAWSAFGLVAVLTVFGDSFDLPGWLVELSPLARTPALPAEQWSTGPVLVLAVVAAALVSAGLAGFRRRDLTTA